MEEQNIEKLKDQHSSKKPVVRIQTPTKKFTYRNLTFFKMSNRNLKILKKNPLAGMSQEDESRTEIL